MMEHKSSIANLMIMIQQSTMGFIIIMEGGISELNEMILRSTGFPGSGYPIIMEQLIIQLSRTILFHLKAIVFTLIIPLMFYFTIILQYPLPTPRVFQIS